MSLIGCSSNTIPDNKYCNQDKDCIISCSSKDCFNQVYPGDCAVIEKQFDCVCDNYKCTKVNI